MATLPPIQTAILCQNTAKTVTLLDIPKSISVSQGTLTQPNTSLIYSITPNQVPYPPSEPKSEAARAKVISAMSTSAPAAYAPGMLRNALKEIKENYCGGDWCLPRLVPPSSSLKYVRRGRKRKFSHHEDGAERDITPVIEPKFQISSAFNGSPRKARSLKPLALSRSTVNSFPDDAEISYNLIHNLHSTPVNISIGSEEAQYRIPPNAAFYLGNIDENTATDFSVSAQSFLSTPTASAGPGQFDFILLDPPWGNRSVKRSGKYTTVRHNSNPMHGLEDTLGKHIAPRGLIACWITNRASVRKCALEAFKAWGVDLVEEWAWLKTTADGLPVTDIEGLWRKPYEILLLGREADSVEKEDGEITVESGVRKRVIIAVPDVHSRKPCLKELIEPFMQSPAEYRALEIFARNLTAGWWSWGNEAIKFNWEGHWQLSR